MKLDPEERIIAAALDQAELDDAKERGAGARITRSRKPPNLARHGGSCQLITLCVRPVAALERSASKRPRCQNGGILGLPRHAFGDYLPLYVQALA